MNKMKASIDPLTNTGAGVPKPNLPAFIFILPPVIILALIKEVGHPAQPGRWSEKFIFKQAKKASGQ